MNQSKEISHSSINKFDLFKVVFYSFLFQGSWNFKKMQNLGFAFSIQPALKKIYQNKEDRKGALLRHLEFYNSHPYMASFVLGAIVRLEEKYSRKEGVLLEDIIILKKVMMGPMGSLGDTFFWASLRPVAAVFAAALAIIGWGAAPFIFLLIFNVPHLYIKFFGVYEGYRCDKKVMDEIKRYNFFQYSIYLKSFMLILLGAMIPFVIKFDKGYADFRLGLFINGSIFLVILLITKIYYRKLTVNKVLLLISSICIVLGLLHII